MDRWTNSGRSNTSRAVGRGISFSGTDTTTGTVTAGRANSPFPRTNYLPVGPPFNT